MALITFRFYSTTLRRNVSAKAVIPFDAENPTEEPYRTLYLLHGYQGDSHDWLLYTDVYELAMNHGMAVILPEGENSFYLNDERTEYPFTSYFAQELVQASRKLFHLSHRREDTFIAGLSMGGYGALRCGLLYSDTFSRVGSFSPALITRWISDPQWQQSRYPHHEWMVFRPRDQIEGSDQDLWALSQKLAEQGTANLPEIFLSCGTEDPLVEPARSMRDHLKMLGVSCTYFEGPGNHDWVFWKDMIRKFLNWTEKK